MSARERRQVELLKLERQQRARRGIFALAAIGAAAIALFLAAVLHQARERDLRMDAEWRGRSGG